MLFKKPKKKKKTQKSKKQKLSMWKSAFFYCESIKGHSWPFLQKRKGRNYCIFSNSTCTCIAKKVRP
jgi:hypothetical protein